MEIGTQIHVMNGNNLKPQTNGIIITRGGYKIFTTLCFLVNIWDGMLPIAKLQNEVTGSCFPNSFNIFSVVLVTKWVYMLVLTLFCT